MASVLLAGIVIGCGGGGNDKNNGSTNATSGSNSGSNAGTNAGTTASNPGGTGGTDGGTGNLPQDSIFYTVSSGAGTGTYDVRYVKEDGTGSGVYATGVSGDAPPASPNPAVSGQFVFAAKPTGSNAYGLYKGTVASATDPNTTRILAPSLGQISTLQVSRDGSKVIYVGATSASSNVQNLYVVSASGGVPTQIDSDVFSASLSSDGSKVVYSKAPTGSDILELYVRFLNETASTRLTNNDVYDDDPQFSKDGTKIVFTQQVSGSTHERLATINLTAGAPYAATTFDPVPTSDFQRGPSFNSAGTRVSFVVIGVPGAQGVWTSNVDGSDARQIVANDNLLSPTYWSTPNGRSIGGQTLGLSRSRRP